MKYIIDIRLTVDPKVTHKHCQIKSASPLFVFQQVREVPGPLTGRSHASRDTRRADTELFSPPPTISCLEGNSIHRYPSKHGVSPHPSPNSSNKS